MHTIVITGGHHNSALVVAKELMSRGHKIIWIGHRNSSREDKNDSAEYKEVKSAGIPFYNLNAAKMIPNIYEIIRFPIGIFQSMGILLKCHPTAVLSFGGYLGGSVALSAKLLGIPIYLHEQTVTAGRANKSIGVLAQKIYLTWPQSAKYFKAGKSMLVGLPLRDSLFKSSTKQFFSRKKPTLLVMGGKQGAHVINQFIFTHLQDLLTHFNIIHQTGTNSKTQDYDHALCLKDELNSLCDSYLPVGYIDEYEIGTYLKSADIYFGRSGAHICYELGILGIPSILTPLMSTHDHEQQKNANILESALIGKILPHSKLDLSQFLGISKELQNSRIKSMSLAKDATDKLVDDLLSNLK